MTALSNSGRLELRVIEERGLYLSHDLWVDVVLVIVLEQRQKVFVLHELLRSEPPIILHNLRVFLLRRSLALSIAHDTDSV